MFSFVKDNKGNFVTYYLKGVLNLYTCHDLKNELTEFSENGCKNVVIDMVDIDTIDSCSIGVLIFISQKIKERGYQLALMNVNSKIRRTIQYSKLENLINLGYSPEYVFA